MDNEDGKRQAIIMPRQIYNQLVLLIEDEDFLAFIQQQWGVLDKDHTIKAFTQCKRSIKRYLQDKKLPQSWLMPLFTLIKDKKLDFPMDNSISLRVGAVEITTNTQNLMIIRDKEGHLSDELSISIVITGKVSADHIIQFIKNNKKQIKYWQEVIGLPAYKNPNWHEVDLGLKIIQLKDEQNLTLQEISDQLVEDENLTEEELDHYSDVAYIKTIYNRYKKRLNSK